MAITESPTKAPIAAPAITGPVAGLDKVDVSTVVGAELLGTCCARLPETVGTVLTRVCDADKGVVCELEIKAIGPESELELVILDCRSIEVWITERIAFSSCPVYVVATVVASEDAPQPY